MDQDPFVRTASDADEDELVNPIFSSHASSLTSDRAGHKDREEAQLVQTMQRFTALSVSLDMGIHPDGSIRPADWQARYSSSANSAGQDTSIQAGHASLSGSYAVLGS